MKNQTSLMLRLPSDLKTWLTEQAAQNERSQNSQIVWLLRQIMEGMKPRDARALCAQWRGQNMNSDDYVATFGVCDASVTTRPSGT